MINPDESLYTTNNLKFLKYIQATLKANLLFEKNVLCCRSRQSCFD